MRLYPGEGKRHAQTFACISRTSELALFWRLEALKSGKPRMLLSIAILIAVACGVREHWNRLRDDDPEWQSLFWKWLIQGAAVPSNIDFDSTLKRRNQEWGLRELEDVTRTAALHGLPRQQVVRMPANNLTVVFAKAL